MQRVLVLGGGKLGEHAVRACVDRGLELVAVVLRRSESATRSDTELSARGLGIPVIESSSSPWNEVGRLLRREQIDYLLSAQYDMIVPPGVLERVRTAALNVHFGPLPRLRGCFPTKWAIINGEPSGVTVHHMDEGIDTGRIVLQELVPVQEVDTDLVLYSRLVEVGYRLIVELVELIATEKVPIGHAQDEVKASYNPKELPFGGVINWTWSVDLTSRFIRAYTFPPHPGAILDQRIPAIQARAPIVKDLSASLSWPGEFEFQGESLKVRCADGAILLSQLAVDGAAVDAAEVEAYIGHSGVFRDQR